MAVQSHSRNNYEPILTEIFTTRPAINEQFISSIAYERRRALLDRDIFTSHIIDIPDMTPPLEDLGLHSGPYERSMMYTMLERISHVGIVRGGTGSGKTSLVRHILSAVAQFCGQHDSFSELGVSTFCVSLDINSLPESFSREYSDDDVALRDVQLNELLGSVSSLLASALEAVLDPQTRSQKLSELYRRAICDEDVSSHRMTPVNTVRSRLAQLLRKTHNRVAEVDHGDYLDEVNQSIDNLKSSHDRLIARLLPFAELARTLSRRGVPFVVIIDNADPLPAYLQRELFSTLRQICTSTRFEFSGLKMVLFLRLSSAADPISAHGAYDVHPHASPMPSDVIYVRLTSFILSPESFPHFHKLKLEHRDDLMRRLISLWAALSDRSGFVSPILDAVCGTNIRNANSMAVGWCLGCDTSGQHDGDTSATDARNAIIHSLAVRACDHIGDLVGNGLRLLIHDIDFEAYCYDVGVDEVASSLADRVCYIAVQVCRNLGLFGTMPANDGRAEVSQSSTESLMAIANSDRLSIVEDQYSALAVQLSSLFHSLRGVSQLRELASAVIDKLEITLIEHLSREAQKSGGALVRGCEAKVEHMLADARSTFKNPIDDRIIKFRTYNADCILRRDMQASLALRRIRVSRYQAATLLLDPAVPMYLPFKAMNLFGSDNSGRALGLRVLYKISDQLHPRSITVAELLEYMCRHGFQESEVRACVNEMVEPDRRLIYSGVSDHFVGVSRLFREPNQHLRLSWAGRDYIDNLVHMPVYIQWALDENCVADNARLHAAHRIYEVDGEGVGARIERACEAMFSIVRSEYESIKAVTMSSGPNGVIDETVLDRELRCQSASLDVCVRAMPRFLHDLSVHASRLSERASDDDAERHRVVQLCRRYVYEVRDLVSAHSKLFGRRIVAWDDEVTFGERGIDELVDQGGERSS